MKEITREDWENNPTPRMMWVWDNNESNKVKRFVIYCIRKDVVYRFLTEEEGGDRLINTWRHCAEIEEPQRMTNYELAKWLYDGASCGEFREYRYTDLGMAYRSFAYAIGSENKPCSEHILIRSDGGEWREPYNIPPECISPTPDEIGG